MKRIEIHEFSAWVRRILPRNADGEKRADGKCDYRVYRLSINEKLITSVIYMLAAAALSELFYDRLWPCILFAPGIIPVFKMVSGKFCERRKKKINAEFKEFLVSLSANMAVGYSLESAFAPVYQELDGIYQGKSFIQGELLMIKRGVDMSADVAVLFMDFAERTGVSDIKEFAEIVMVSRKTGGNLIHMMKRMVANMEGRLEVEDEIDTMITSKRFEHNIMSVMPFAIVLYLRVCNKGYMDALYGNALGAVLMTVCLMIIIMAVIWGYRIVDIDV